MAPQIQTDEIDETEKHLSPNVETPTFFKKNSSEQPSGFSESQLELSTKQSVQPK